MTKSHSMLATRLAVLSIITSWLGVAALANAANPAPAALPDTPPKSGQTTIVLSTGGAGGTYDTQATDILRSCSAQVNGSKLLSTGTVENLDRLLQTNTANVVFAQTDAVFQRALTEDLSNVYTLLALHPEELHLVARRDWAPAQSVTDKALSLFNRGPQAQLNTLNDLAGRRVAVFGGSIVTGKILRLQSEVASQLVDMADFASAKAALDAKQVDAILAVGGAPLSTVAGMGPNYKLLAIPEDKQAKLKDVYRPARLTYSGLGSDMRGITTVSTDALLVTLGFTTPRMKEALRSLRTCVLDNLSNFKESPGYHVKWRQVDPANRGKWRSWYE